MQKDKVQDLKVLFGSLVKANRTERGMTQGDLAEAAGLSLDMISRLERGAVGPSLETMIVLSDILNVPVSVLLGGAPLDRQNDSVREAGLLRIHKLIAGIGTDDLRWIEGVISAAMTKG